MRTRALAARLRRLAPCRPVPVLRIARVPSDGPTPDEALAAVRAAHPEDAGRPVLYVVTKFRPETAP